jgi:hypothetical protein
MATTTTLVKAPRTLIAAATSNAANATKLGAPVDLRTANGGILTVKVKPLGTLGNQAVVTVVAAHDAGTTPAAAVAGAVWKTIATLGGSGTVSGAETELPPYIVPFGVMHLNVVVTGNTTSAVECEAFMSEVSSASSV